MPTHKISLKRFKSLLNRRSKALSGIRSTTTATTSNPNLIHNGAPIELVPENAPPSPLATTACQEEDGETSKPGTSAEVKDQGQLDSGDSSAKPNDVRYEDDEKQPQVAEKGAEIVNDVANLQLQKPDDLPNPNWEATCKDDELTDKGKRKKEVEEKLQVLNARKHSLVQVLKQILNAEEELKRRNSMQGMAIRPSVQLQVDVPNDSGSMTRHATPRMGSEANLGGDMEGGEIEDVSNHNIHSRQLHRMSSTSPSSESPLRRLSYIQQNVVPHPSRSSLGTSGSPSRFAPTGHQVHPANMLTVSVSGTNYIASSPSPAASGGTSAFRDARQPSPWN